MSKFEVDANWLHWCKNPTKPTFKLPKGSVDAHCHVFGPGDIFPFSPERKYTPCDASKDQLFALRDYLGLERNVIVQATCHGSDNSALVDALIHSQGKAKGVATVKSTISDEELQALDFAGVKGVRFNFVKRLVDTLPFDSLESIAHRIKKLGWHIVIYFEAQDLAQYYDFFTSLPVTIVVDHMGRPDVSKPVKGSDFDLFIKLLSDNDNFWSKVSCPERISNTGPNGYQDAIPFGRRVVEEFPDRVLWGTDWPHPNMKTHIPDDGNLVNFIPQIAPTQELQHKLLVANPLKLYWPELK
ncbi:amidohydrolase family protein [Colwellia sp. RE-S-Sl-9]